MMQCTNTVNGSRCGGVVEDGFCQTCFADYSSAPITSEVGGPATGNSSGGSSSTGRKIGSKRGSSHRLGSGKSVAEILGMQHQRKPRNLDMGSASSSSRRRRSIGGAFVDIPPVPPANPERLLRTKYWDEGVAQRRCTQGHDLVRQKPDGTYLEQGICPKCREKFDFSALEPLPIKTGAVVANQYEIRGTIAKGGNGYIYLAKDLEVDQWVVIKSQIRRTEQDRATSLAEKKMLANLRNPSICSIFGFKEHNGTPLIVIEFVDGKSIGDIYKENNGPLAVATAVAYVLAMCESMTFLHTNHVLNPDVKPANFMQTGNRMVQIDAGGWIAFTDSDANVTTTLGYPPREVDDPDQECSPTPYSDQYSLGRIAVVLCNSFDYTSNFRWKLPDLPSFTQYPSYGDWVRRACADDPADRFASVEEFMAQGYGVLREIVAIDSGESKPWISDVFDGDTSGGSAKADFHLLPSLRVDQDDEGHSEVETVARASGTPADLRAMWEAAVAKFPKSREAKLRLAGHLTDSGELKDAEEQLVNLSAADPDDWRNAWYLGRLRLAQGEFLRAVECFGTVVSMLPGEPAAKLALGLSAELSGDDVKAITAYDLVSLVEPQYTSAAFGLARCLLREGNRESAVKALKRVPAGHIAHVPADAEASRILCDTTYGAPSLADLQQAEHMVEALDIAGMQKHRLRANVYQAAALLIDSGSLQADSKVKLLGVPFTRKALGHAFCAELLAGRHECADAEELEKLVREAHSLRPVTLF